MRSWWWAWVGTAVGVLFSYAFAGAVHIAKGPFIEVADSSSAIISWATDEPSNSRVWYGEDADDLTGIAEGPERTTEHRVRIEGLQPNTTYYFQIESVPSSTSSKTENPAIMSFRTVAVGQQSVHNQKASIAQRGLSTFGEEETVKR